MREPPDHRQEQKRDFAVPEENWLFLTPEANSPVCSCAEPVKIQYYSPSDLDQRFFWGERVKKERKRETD